MIEKLPAHKSLDQSFTVKFYQTFREELTTILLKLFFKKTKNREDSKTLFMRPGLSEFQNQIKTQGKKITGQYF